jgi:hypothetical protein
MKTKVNLVKNKLRAMGLKMSYEPEGKQIDEVLGGQSGDGYIGHPRLGIKNPLNPPVKGGATFAPKNTGVVGRLGNRASQVDAAMQQLRQSYEPEGEVIDEAEQRIKQSRQPAKPSGTYDPTGIGMYPRTGKERKKMRKGEPVGKYPSLSKRDENDSDDRDHPSLSARERNPNLR